MKGERESISKAGSLSGMMESVKNAWESIRNGQRSIRDAVESVRDTKRSPQEGEDKSLVGRNCCFKF